MEDIERIDWWEKEKPPLYWINFDQYKARQEFIQERKIKLLPHLLGFLHHGKNYPTI